MARSRPADGRIKARRMMALTCVKKNRLIGNGFLFALMFVFLAMLTGIGAPSFSAQYASIAPFSAPPPHRNHPQGRNAGLSKGRFLVASRGLFDKNFSRTVILLTDYGDRGALGLIVNRPTELKLPEAFPDVSGLSGRTEAVYFGGPVKTGHMLLLFRSHGEEEGAQRVFEDVYISSSRGVLERIAGRSDAKLRIYAGYAGWAPGQLEREVSMGGWRVVEADAKTIFDKAPSEIWPFFMR